MRHWWARWRAWRAERRAQYVSRRWLMAHEYDAGAFGDPP
jgi:hypothetical protein